MSDQILIEELYGRGNAAKTTERWIIESPQRRIPSGDSLDSGGSNVLNSSRIRVVRYVPTAISTLHEPMIDSTSHHKYVSDRSSTSRSWDSLVRALRSAFLPEVRAFELSQSWVGQCLLTMYASFIKMHDSN